MVFHFMQKCEIMNIIYGNSAIFKNRTGIFVKYLTCSELEKASRFLHEEDRVCYIVTHGLLKKYLYDSGNTDLPNAIIHYSNGEKPFIQGLNHDFNISHSGKYFALGIAKDNLRIGIDIEKLNHIPDMESVVRSYFSASEYGYIYDTDSDTENQIIRFYEIWTRKEAFLKMAGIGLLTDLSKISISPYFSYNKLQISECQIPTEAFIFSKNYNEFILSVASTQNIELQYIEADENLIS